MKYYILASGSSGNCAVIQSDDEFIVLDCGCSATYLKNAFASINLDYHQAKAVLITHFHCDHLKQTRMFCESTFYAPFKIESVSQKFIEPYQPFQVGRFTILAMLLSHDCNPTVGYIITDGKETLVQLTDSGYVSETNKELIKGADYYIFESNHDIEMLKHTSRPPILIERILSNHGHMDNNYAANVLNDVISDKTKEIILAHISREANCYQLAYDVTNNIIRKNHPDFVNLYIKAIEQFEIYQGGH